MKLIPTKLITLIFSIISLFVLSGCGSTGTASETQLVGGTPEVVPPVATITSIQIRPTDVTVPKGTTGTYAAIAFYDDNTQEDVTKKVIWTSADASVVSIVSSGDESGDAESLKVGSTTIIASLDDVTSNTARVTVTDAILQRIIVTPFIERVASGIDVQYAATGIYSDKTHGNLAQWATWQSSTMSVATIDAAGLANTLSVGTTNITASFDSVASNTATLEVTTATMTSIQVTPADTSVPKGTTGTYTAIAYYTDNTSEDITREATWISGDDTIVAIVPTGVTAGDALAMTVGSTTITAGFNGVTSNTANVEVTAATLSTLSITPILTDTPTGMQVQYSAIGSYSDGTSLDLTTDPSIIWKSSDTSKATISLTGLADTLAVGSTNITASFDAVDSNTAVLNVIAATIASIQITPADVTVPAGTTGNYTAIAYFSNNTSQDVTDQVNWLAADSSVVEIKTAGDAKALTVGTTTITATLDGIISNTANIEVTAATLQSIVVTPDLESVASGINVQYTAMGIYSDNSSHDLTLFSSWKSSDISIATIEGKGAVSGTAYTLSVGTTNITASFDGVTSNTATLEVTTATMTSIQVTPADTSVPKGTTGTYTAIAYYTDNTSEDITRQATWISGDDTIVAIVPTGVTAGDALAMTVGSTTITAGFNGVTSNTATVEVTAATLISIEIVAHDINFPAGTTVYYTALAYYSDLSVTDITNTSHWSSDETTIATVVMGEVAGISAGSTNINIEYEGKNDSQPITVTEPVITSLLITPPTHSMTTGSHKQYVATAYYNNGTTKNVTKDVTWHSSVPEYAVVSNVFGTQGQALARNVGTTEIYATYDGTQVGNTVTLTVLAVTVTLDSIVVTPADLTVTVESTIGYLAEGHYSNGDVVDITTNVTWASSNTHSATIEASGELIGVATAVTSGTSTTISAALDGILGQTTLTVDGDCGSTKPDSIYITPDPVNIVKGYQKQIHLIGVWTSEGCEREITFDPAAVWDTDDQDIASMGSKGGVIFGHEVGNTNVNAKYRARTTSAPVNVTD